MPPQKKDKADASPAWKDSINRGFVEKIAASFKVVHKSFDTDGYVQAVLDAGLLKQELKERIRTVGVSLRPFLPKDFRKAVDVLIAATARLKGFGSVAMCSFVEEFGRNEFETSVYALAELTKYGSAELAVRAFIIDSPERMLPVLHKWADDTNEHVRRLAAEGSRPRGVWVSHIEPFRRNPQPVLELLGKLNRDPSLYVRKAVANNLNDISKDHPDAVIATCLNWTRNGSAETDWICKHACRSLIKAGRPEVFELFGFADKPKLKGVSFELSKKRIRIGDKLTLKLRVTSAAKASQKLAIDYRVHLVRSRGKTSAKVFKWAEKSLAAGESLDLTKTQAFEDLSTRTHFPGKHRIEVLINGSAAAEAEFVLTE